MAEQSAVGQLPSRPTDPAIDVLPIDGLRVPGTPAVGAHRGHLRLAVDGGHRGVSIQRQDRRLAIVRVRGQPGPQIPGRQHRGDRHRAGFVERTDCTGGRPCQRNPAGEMDQRGARWQGDEAIGDADLPTAAGRGLQRGMNAQPPLGRCVEEAVHTATLSVTRAFPPRRSGAGKRA